LAGKVIDDVILVAASLFLSAYSFALGIVFHETGTVCSSYDEQELVLAQRDCGQQFHLQHAISSDSQPACCRKEVWRVGRDVLEFRDRKFLFWSTSMTVCQLTMHSQNSSVSAEFAISHFPFRHLPDLAKIGIKRTRILK
jgi:hypothetical protein